MNYNAALPFYHSMLAHPERLAVSSEGNSLTYGEFGSMVLKMASGLQKGKGGKLGRVGMLASRSIEACAGVLATCWLGGTYVPIGLKLPEERLLAVIELSQLDAVITDAKGLALLTERVLRVCPKLIIVPEKGQYRQHEGDRHTVYGVDELFPTQLEPVEVGPDELAYIEFTSGTTGVPKGVMIHAGGLHQYISVIQDMYKLTHDDRLAETADLSFDISVSNMFAAWNAGASLHIVPATQAMAPAKFIQNNQLTYWYSVPSIISFMKSIKALPPDAFPTLRCTIFAGEPLPAGGAMAWKEAAPNSIIDNLYGPTEATVVCLVQRVTDPPRVTPERDVIAIGKPFPGTEVEIFDDQFRPVKQGTTGELALGGIQVAKGYFGQEELTAKRFRMIDGKRWYLTGDWAYQDKDGIYHHLGRMDNQVKVMGNRVELEEIETHLRTASSGDLSAAVAWPISHGSATGIVGFVTGTAMKPMEIRNKMKERLPAYMVPSVVHVLPELPMSANGKVDRKALIAELEKGKA